MWRLTTTGGLFVALSGLLLIRGATEPAFPDGSQAEGLLSSGSAGAWFRSMKPYCNSVEIETHHRWMPPPKSWEGSGYDAACFALAGKVDRAREIILALPGDERWRAAGVVFEVGHPIADAGDDLSAGPIMELVVEFQPDHYMALYHAGMAHYMTDQPLLARKYLQSFLNDYDRSDGWRSNALAVLAKIGNP